MVDVKPFLIFMDIACLKATPVVVNTGMWAISTSTMDFKSLLPFSYVYTFL